MDLGIHPPGMYPLSTLMPYKLETKKGLELAAVLKEYSLLLKAALETHRALVTKKLHLFDPLVGDNFCQSRALRVALTFGRCAIGFKQKSSAIESHLAYIESMLTSRPLKWFKTCNLTCQDILKQDQEIYLTEDEFFMLLSYLLTVIKKESAPTSTLPWVDKTEPGRLNSLGKVSTNFAQNLIKILREKLADTSVQFVRKLSHLFMNEKNSLMLSDEHTHLYNKRIKCLHFYYGTKTIFECALQLGIPVVVWSRQLSQVNNKVIRDVCIFYRATASGYEEESTKLTDFGKGVIVVQGAACLSAFPRKKEWKTLLDRYNPSKLLAACSAEHRPYPDPSVKAHNDDECEYFKLKAKKWGCTIENPSLFFITHVFCATLENIAPMKYELNSHLQKYFDFYIEYCIQELKKLEGTSTFTVDGNTLTFHMNSAAEKSMLQRRIQKALLFMVKPKIKDGVKDCAFQVELEIDLNPPNARMYKVVAIAKNHPHPSKFLLDHWAFWCFSSEAAIEYLIADPKNFEHEELLEIIIEILKEGEHYFKTQKQALVGLGRALFLPSIKEKAKSFLMEFVEMTDKVSHNYHRYKSLDKLKICALRQLNALLNEADVRLFLQKVAAKHPLLSLQFEARSHLDGAIEALTAFNLELIRKLIDQRSSLESIRIKNIFLDEILWVYYPYSCQYVTNELGEEKLYSEIISQYASDTILYGEKTVSYSILKFIALHTSNQELFSKLVYFLMHAAHDDDERTRLISPFQTNQKVSMPADAAHLIQPLYEGTLSLHGPIECPVPFIDTTVGQHLTWALYEMVGSRDLDHNVRLLSIRHCLPFFVFERDSNCWEGIEEARRLDDRWRAVLLRTPLERLSKDPTENKALVLAALHLLHLHEEDIYNVENTLLLSSIHSLRKREMK